MSGGAKVGRHWTCLDCDWRGYAGGAIRHERQKFHRVAPEPAPDPSASAASPLCSCGARAVEDGGTEGRCECCTDCERMPVSNGNDIEPKGDGVSSDLNAEGPVVARSLLAAAMGRIRHDHAYPMAFGPHHCPGCDVEDDICAALGLERFCRSPFCSVSPDRHGTTASCPAPSGSTQEADSG